LLIQLRNTGAHKTPSGSSVSPETKQRLAEIRDALARQPGGLAQSTETLTRRVFEILSALTEPEAMRVRT
jgi:hypothetical protein